MGRTDQVGRRVLEMVGRYKSGLRRRIPHWKAAWTARPIIRELRNLKSSNVGRPLCGILLLEHIGDIIACEPVIGQLKRAHPDALIVWVVNGAYRALLDSHPQLDAVICASSLFELEEIVRSGAIDQIVDLHVNLKDTNFAEVYYEKQSGDPSINAYNYFLKGSLLAALSMGAGLEPSGEAPTIHVPDDAVRGVRNLGLPDHFVVVHTKSNMDSKNWAGAKWHDLVEYILEHYDTHVVEVGLGRSIDIEHDRFVSLCGSLSIVQTAEVVRTAAFFIGVDSGPAHMANAWGTPGLLLFGRMYGHDAFNPYEGYYAASADSVILRHPGSLHDLSVREAIGALESSELWKAACRNRKRPTEPSLG